MKKFVSMFLILCMLCAAVPLQANAAAQTTVQKIVAAYTEYYSYLQTSIKKYGIRPFQKDTFLDMGEYYSATKTGVMFAYLLDFTGDGINDLFVVEADEKKDIRRSILTCENGTLEKIDVTLQYDNFEWWKLSTPEAITCGSIDGWKHFGFCTDRSGKHYLFVEGNYDSSVHGSGGVYITVKNGKLVKQEAGVVAVPSSYKNGKYYIGTRGCHLNGTETTLKSLVEFAASMKANGCVRYSADKMPSRNVVQEMVDFLAINISPSYVAGYNEPASWAQDAVERGIQEGLIPFELQCKYNQPITRLEFCTLAVNLYEKRMGTKIVKMESFHDTADYNARKMAGLGIVGGVGGGNFDPDGLLTREMAAIILVRLAEAMGARIPSAAPDFSDNQDISSWAKDFVGRSKRAGIMNGTGGNRFAPKENYTREQSILTLMSLEKTVDSVTDISVDLKYSYSGSFDGRTMTCDTHDYESVVVTVVNGGMIKNPSVRWTSSNPDVAWFDSDNSKVITKYAGTAKLTATAMNGTAYSFTVKVIQRSGTPYFEPPATIRFFANCDDWYEYGNMYVTPKDPVYAGTIVVTDVVSASGGDIELKYVVTDLVEETAYKSCVYIRWYVEDESGEIVASGIERGTQCRYLSEGGEETLEISPFGLNYRENYRLYLISD